MKLPLDEPKSSGNACRRRAPAGHGASMSRPGQRRQRRQKFFTEDLRRRAGPVNSPHGCSWSAVGHYELGVDHAHTELADAVPAPDPDATLSPRCAASITITGSAGTPNRPPLDVKICRNVHTGRASIGNRCNTMSTAMPAQPGIGRHAIKGGAIRRAGDLSAATRPARHRCRHQLAICLQIAAPGWPRS